MAQAARADVPRKGYALSTAVERYGKPVRSLAGRLLADLAARDLRAIADAMGLVAPPASARSVEELAARALAAVWLCKRSLAGAEDDVGALLKWFFGAAAKNLPAPAKASKAFAAASAEWPNSASEEELSTLLPYALDPHGPGSRLSVMKDASTNGARQARKSDGVFYTPGDVADFMIGRALTDNRAVAELTFLDPACGTGVFLRSALRQVAAHDPNRVMQAATEQLFGVDIDPWAVAACVFVLMHDAVAASPKTRTRPATIWKRIKFNIACADALRIDLEAGASQSPGSRLALDELFPALAGGADVVVGNPPYADIGARADLPELARIFDTLKASTLANADVYPIFVEQMVRLARTSGALVVPLSIACNTGKQFVALRKFISRAGGRWSFAFFDREPHALFGEDVKTRNAVIHWSRGGKATQVFTGPLRKWRGDERAAMLQSISYVRTTRDIGVAIPKLGGEAQVRALEKLSANGSLLRHFVPVWGKATIADLAKASAKSIFIAPTAYNFLGVSRPASLPTTKGEALSTNPLIRLACASETDAHAVYALLNSRLTYWWWHVLGDGFHVTASMLQDMPLANALHGSSGAKLAKLGAELWAKVEAHPVRSVNRGRTSFSFSANEHEDIRDQIDTVICAALGLDDDFRQELKAFTQQAVSARMSPADQSIAAPELPASGVLASQESSFDWQPTPAKPTPEMKKKSVLTKEEWRDYTKTVWAIANKSHPDHPAVFPVEIPHRLTKLFSFYGETVLDPFAGTGTTARAAIPLGRRALCIEQNSKYAEIIRRDCAALRNGHDPGFVPLHVSEGDARNMSFVQDNSVGVVITSPPYWDKADYGAGHANLGNIASYPEFIESMRPVLSECYRVLMPGRKLCLVTANVNQHTDHGLLTFPLATDLAVLMRELGFVMVNELIWSKDGTGGKWGSYGEQRPIFGSYPHPPNFLFKNVHEYILIFAKPPAVKTKGPKVKPYSELMQPARAAQIVRLPIDLPTLEA